MAKGKTGLTSSLDGLDWIIKLILFIPPLAIIWFIYRIVLLVENFSGSRLVGLLLWFVGIGWLIDLISTIVNKKIDWLT